MAGDCWSRIAIKLFCFPKLILIHPYGSIYITRKKVLTEIGTFPTLTHITFVSISLINISLSYSRLRVCVVGSQILGRLQNNKSKNTEKDSMFIEAVLILNLLWQTKNNPLGKILT